MISSEITSQVISDQILPTIRETLGEISCSAWTNVDLTSSERHRSHEIQFRKKVWKNVPNMTKTNSIQNRDKTENSFESHSCNEGYDKR